MVAEDHLMAESSSSPRPSTPKPASSTPQPKEGWEITLEQLRRTNEELQRRKVDAEKDREFFRDLYNTASSHVSEVAKENSSLQERVERLETQLREGLAMVRSTYESQIKELEGERERWKALYEILQVRDRKTNGDEIRRKAACEGELRRENQSLKLQLQILREDYENMEAAFDRLDEKELQTLNEQEETFKSTIDEEPTSASTAMHFGFPTHSAVSVS